MQFPSLSFLLRLGRYTIEEALKCSNKILQEIPLYPLVTGICQVSVDLNKLSRLYPRNEEFGRYASNLLTKQQRALPNPQETLVSSFQTEPSTMCFPLKRKRAAMECLNYQNRPTQTCNFLSIQKPKWLNKHKNTRTQKQFIMDEPKNIKNDQRTS